VIYRINLKKINITYCIVWAGLQDN